MKKPRTEKIKKNYKYYNKARTANSIHAIGEFSFHGLRKEGSYEQFGCDCKI